MTLARYTAGPAGNNLQMWPARNPGSEEIPAFACVKIDSVLFLSDDQIVYNLSKPDTFGSQWGHAFNGPRPIAAGGNDYGYITVGPLAVGMYDTADGTPEAGQFWGPRDADWKLRKSTGGFRILGVENQNQYSGQRTDLIVVQQWPMLTMIGKADAIISSDTTNTVSIYWKQPNPAGSTLTDTGVNILARNRLETDIAANDWVILNWFPHGWEIVRQQAY